MTNTFSETFFRAISLLFDLECPSINTQQCHICGTMDFYVNYNYFYFGGEVYDYKKFLCIPLSILVVCKIGNLGDYHNCNRLSYVCDIIAIAWQTSDRARNSLVAWRLQFIHASVI